jgi:hypothetical protein
MVSFRESLQGTHRARERPLVEAMMADIEKALALSPSGAETSEFYVDAARLFARASRIDGGRAEQAVRYGRLAVECGQEPTTVNRHLGFFLEKPFTPLRPSGGLRQAWRALYVVDPLPDLPTESLFGL